MSNTSFFRRNNTMTNISIPLNITHDIINNKTDYTMLVIFAIIACIVILFYFIYCQK